MKNLGKTYCEVVKWILGYLRGTPNMTLCFKSGDATREGYVDFDLVDNVDNKKVLKGIFILFTLYGTIIS